jgi:hypothetical protein
MGLHSPARGGARAVRALGARRAFFFARRRRPSERRDPSAPPAALPMLPSATLRAEGTGSTRTTRWRFVSGAGETLRTSPICVGVR